MSEYKMYMSLGQKELFDALVLAQYKPTEENKRKLKELEDKNTLELNEIQTKREIIFREAWGDELFDFVKSISNKYFLVGREPKNIFPWQIRADYDNEDYWTIVFYDKQFHYQKETCSGYGETVLIEQNISKERVLELLKTQQP